MKLHWQILIAVALAFACGAVVQNSQWFDVSMTFISTLFLNALKMLIVPLVLSAMINAILGVGGDTGLSRLGVRTVVYFLSTTLLAVLTGLVLVNLIAPGIINGQAAGAILGLHADTQGMVDKISGRDSSDIAEVFLRAVPTNIVDAAAKGEMLGLIVFGLLFGYFASKLAPEMRQTQQKFWQGLYEVMISIIEWVMRFAPIGVFALVSKTVAQTGWAAVEPLSLFCAVVLIGLFLQTFVFLPLMLMAARLSPLAHFKATMPVLLTAFSTSSSSATLPVTLDRVQKYAGVSPRISGFVLPLGATVNMNGTALYECVVAIFIAQAYGIDLSFAQQFLIVLLALVTSIGVAGIPSASLVAISVILSTIGLPLEGIGIILAVDRILDMCRTAVNVFGDTVGAVIIAKLEGEPVLQNNRN